MYPVNISAFDVRSSAAGCRIPFGALCARSAAGVCKPTVSGTVYSFWGVADDDAVRKDVPGFWAENENIPLITAGVCYLWLLGGETINDGEFLKIAATLGAGTEFLGVVQPETTPTTKTAATIARVIGGDTGNADYDQDVTSISGDIASFASADVVASLGISVGSRVVIDSDEAAEFNIVKAISGADVTLQLSPNASHATGIKCYHLQQVGVMLE